MKFRRTLIFPVLVMATVLSLILAACAQATPTSLAMAEKPTEAMVETTTEAMMEDPTEAPMGTPEAMLANEGGAMVMPAYFSAQLTDIRTGQSFSVANFKGKVVLVETLAQWCSNCLKQQMQVLDLHTTLGAREDFVSLGLDIDPNEDAASLKGYIERNGFTWLYAVAPAEVSREIANLYGDQFVNPPSTPMLIIDRHGKAHPLPFGIKSAADLMEALQPFLDETL